MAKKKVPEAATTEVLDRLAEVGLVDDAAFARQWVASGEHRMRSRAVLLQELRLKGVDSETAEEALAEEGVNDRDVALRFATKKARTLGGLDRQVAYRRLCGALSRRGFAPSVVASVASQVLSVDTTADGGFE